MFHGNGGNMGHRIPLAKVFYAKMRCNVLMVSYRGHVSGCLAPEGCLDMFLLLAQVRPFRGLSIGERSGQAACLFASLMTGTFPQASA